MEIYNEIYNENFFLIFQKFSVQNLMLTEIFHEQIINFWRTKVGQGGVEMKNTVQYPGLSSRTSPCLSLLCP